MNIGETKKYYTGAGLLKPICFCPTREELNKLLGTEGDREIEYVKNTTIKQGDQDRDVVKVSLVLWAKELKTGMIFSIPFDIYNINNVSKAGNFQYINQHGKATWIDDEKNLKKEFKFTKKGAELEYKPCLKGLEEVYKFFRAFIQDSHMYFGGSQEENIMFNEDKFFNGEFGQLNELLEKLPNNKVVAVAGVDEVLDETRKTYQKWCTKAFLPGRMFHLYELNSENGFEYVFDFIEKKVIAQQGDKMSIGYFLKTVSDDQTWKSFRKYGLLSEYNEAENPAINEGVQETPWYN